MPDSPQEVLNIILPDGAYIWFVFITCMLVFWKAIQPAFRRIEDIAGHLHLRDPDSLTRLFKNTILVGYGIGILALFVFIFGIWSLDLLKSAVHSAETWEPRIQYIDNIKEDPLDHKYERLNPEESEDLLIYLSKKDESNGTYSFQVENDVPQTLSINAHLLPAIKRYFWIILATIIFLYVLVFLMLALIVSVMKAFWSNVENGSAPGGAGASSDEVRGIETERRSNNRVQGNWMVCMTGPDGDSELRSIIDLSVDGVKLSGGKTLQRGLRVALRNIHSKRQFSAEVLSDSEDSVRLRFAPDSLSPRQLASIIGEESIANLDNLATV